MIGFLIKIDQDEKKFKKINYNILGFVCEDNSVPSRSTPVFSIAYNFSWY